MRTLGILAGLIACMSAMACISSQIDANRDLWLGFKESQAHSQDFQVRSRENFFKFEGASIASTGEEDFRPPGLRLLAHEVLGSERPKGSIAVKRTGFTPYSIAGVDGAKRTVRGRYEQQMAARRHVFGEESADLSVESTNPVEFTPVSFRESTFLRQYVTALDRMYAERGITSDVNLSAGEVEEFGRKAANLSTDHEEAQRSTVGRLFSLYASAYLKGKFVDRLGRLYPKPSIFNRIGGEKPTITIGNDALTGFASVALEAVTDAALGTPVPCELQESGKPKYFTENGREPTFAALFGIIIPIREDPGAPGLTKLELDLMSYVSDLAGTKSKLLAGLVFSLLDEAEIEFIVGAHFKLGGNDALKVLLEALFEVASRKFTEYLAFEALIAFDYDNRDGTIVPVGSSNNARGRVIALLLQEQEILGKLLPAE